MESKVLRLHLNRERRPDSKKAENYVEQVDKEKIYSILSRVLADSHLKEVNEDKIFHFKQFTE